MWVLYPYNESQEYNGCGGLRDNLPCMQLLDKILEAGSPEGKKWFLDTIDEHGYAAIHYIVLNDHNRNKPALLETLVISGANIDLTTTHRGELTAVHLAVEVCLQLIINS